MNGELVLICEILISRISRLEKNKKLKSTENSPIKSDSPLADQGILRNLWKRKIHHCVHKAEHSALS
jgi:hypothetical protein